MAKENRHLVISSNPDANRETVCDMDTGYVFNVQEVCNSFRVSVLGAKPTLSISRNVPNYVYFREGSWPKYTSHFDRYTTEQLENIKRARALWDSDKQKCYDHTLAQDDILSTYFALVSKDLKEKVTQLLGQHLIIFNEQEMDKLSTRQFAVCDPETGFVFKAHRIVTPEVASTYIGDPMYVRTKRKKNLVIFNNDNDDDLRFDIAPQLKGLTPEEQARVTAAHAEWSTDGAACFKKTRASKDYIDQFEGKLPYPLLEQLLWERQVAREQREKTEREKAARAATSSAASRINPTKRAILRRIAAGNPAPSTPTIVDANAAGKVPSLS